jgi:2-keto-4-pentenoate hydratase
MMSQNESHRIDLEELAEELFRAEWERRPVPPISTGRPWLGPDEAYRVQQEIVRRRVASGETIVGWKIGLTSRAMQLQLEVDQPDYAPVLSSALVGDGAPISVDELIQPRIEAEICFRLERPLRGPGVTGADVIGATAGVAAALEVIDSRIKDWRITLADTIADLASSARVVVAERFIPLDGLDLSAVGVVLEQNGEAVESGIGAAVLGNPADAVAWACNTLGRLGITLAAGHLVMPGAMHASAPVSRGDAFVARFDRLGAVRARFV